jgi:hypothetical protein
MGWRNTAIIRNSRPSAMKHEILPTVNTTNQELPVYIALRNAITLDFTLFAREFSASDPMEKTSIATH